MASRRRVRHTPGAMLFGVDIMACFVGILLLVVNQDKAKIELEIRALEEEKQRVALQIDELERAREREVRRAQEEFEARRAEAGRRREALEREIGEVEQRLRDKQRSFRDWDWVVTRYVRQERLSRRPDGHLYIHPGKVTSDGATALTDAQLIAYLRSLSGSGEQPPLIAAWLENGTNDEYIRVLDFLDAHPELAERIRLHFILLPGGAKAGPHRNQIDVETNR